MTAGAVVIWGGDAPTLRVLEMRDRLVIGHDILDDPELGGHRIEVTRGLRGLLLRDLDQTGRTYIDGVPLESGSRNLEQSRSLIGIGSTLLLVVEDLAPYVGRTLTRRYGLDVAVSLHAPCEAFARAMLDEINVAIAGPRWVTHQLGRAYLEARGGGVEIDVAVRSRTIENALAAAKPHAILLESPNALVKPELRTLQTWLETDVRFVTCMRDARDLHLIPSEIRRWLTQLVIEIPEPRYDELPTVLHTAAAYAAPSIKLHTSVVEEFLLEARERSEDELFARFSVLLRESASRGDRVLYGNGGLSRGPRRGKPTFRMASYPVEDDESS